MKLGIPLLALGVLLLFLAIPYSIIAIIVGMDQAQSVPGFFSSGLSRYLGLIAVIVGFVLTTIGAVRTFKQ
jgi:hypothetical protein